MGSQALVFVLASAVVHALWNMLLAGARDSRAATAVATAVGALVLVPIVVADWRFEREAVPFALSSAAIHVAYVLLLGIAYSRSALSLVYPVARGLSPVVVLVLAAIFGGLPGSVGIAGVVIVGVGVVGLRALGRRGLVLGALLGLTLGTITTLDSHGIEHAGAAAYVLVILGPSALVSVGLELARGKRAALVHELGWRTLLAGVGFVSTYWLILLALRQAPAATVASVRELSIVVAVALGAIVLREPVTRRRAAAACVVALGAALAAAGA
ncbi:MAG: EamA family transporter [Gaiella sp.]